MLRRHLKKGGAPVSACAGFDVEAASAYLENALGNAARTRFESHLAGCPSCRHHVIELFRLAPSAAPVAAPSAPVTGGSLAWSRWRSAVVERFKGRLDLSAWHWNWRLAGVSAVAATSLVVVMLAQPWRQPNSTVASLPAPRMSEAATSAHPVQEKGPATKISSLEPGELEALKAAPAATANAPAANAPAQSLNAQLAQPELRAASSPVPSPKVGALTGAADAYSGVPSEASVARLVREGASKRTTSDLAFNITEAVPPATPAPASVSAQPAKPEPAKEEAAAGADAETMARRLSGTNDQPPAAPLPGMAPRFEIPDDDNEMRDTTRERRRARAAAAEKDSARADKPRLVDRIIIGLVPGSKGEAEDKKAADKDKDEKKEDEAAAFLVKHVHDKTFHYERSKAAWVDQVYKPETMAWQGMIEVQAGTKEYDRIVAEEPVLKEFFNIGRRVVVVWKRKIYRFLGK